MFAFPPEAGDVMGAVLKEYTVRQPNSVRRPVPVQRPTTRMSLRDRCQILLGLLRDAPVPVHRTHARTTATSASPQASLFSACKGPDAESSSVAAVDQERRPAVSSASAVAKLRETVLSESRAAALCCKALSAAAREASGQHPFPKVVGMIESLLTELRTEKRATSVVNRKVSFSRMVPTTRRKRTKRERKAAKAELAKAELAAKAEILDTTNDTQVVQTVMEEPDIFVTQRPMQKVSSAEDMEILLGQRPIQLGLRRVSSLSSTEDMEILLGQRPMQKVSSLSSTEDMEVLLGQRPMQKVSSVSSTEDMQLLLGQRPRLSSASSAEDMEILLGQRPIQTVEEEVEMQMEILLEQ